MTGIAGTSSGSATRAASRDFELRFHCVQCGAPVAMGDDEVTAACNHCSSLLFLSHGGRSVPEAWLAECYVRGDDELIRAWVERRVGEERARTCTAWQQAHGGEFLPEAEPPFLAARLREAAERFRASVELGERRLLHVPYWHSHGLVVQGVVGRRRGGAKLTRVRAFTLEHTLPAYDSTRWNFRDRGLRLARTELRLLGEKDAEDGFTGLPVVSGDVEEQREVQRWCARNLVAELEPIVQHASHVGARRMLVYKPLWVVEYQSARSAEWLLVDGQTSTIAGDLSAGEARATLDATQVRPLDAGSPARVVVLASRCVECGRDLPHEPRAWVRACETCHVGLATTERGLARLSYGHAEPEGAPARPAWLPFWRYSFRLTPPDGQTMSELGPVQEAFGLPPALKVPRLTGEHLWVPAFRLLGTRGGDEAFQKACEWIHRADLEVRREAVPPVGTGRLVSTTLPEAEARELGKSVLYAAQDKATTYRLNRTVAQRLINDAHLELSDPLLVMVAFEDTGDGYRAPGGSRPFVPLLCVDGGPALDAQRRSVQQAQRG